LGAGRPGQASADGTEGPTTFTGPISATTSTSTASIIGQSTGGSSGVGVYANTQLGTGDAVQGFGSSSANGVYGITSGSGFAGVRGDNGAFGPGVWGAQLNSNGPGVLGTSNIGVQGNGSLYGVFGFSSSGTGVGGQTTTAAGGPPAVQGTNLGPGPAVVGFSGTGTGVSGGTVSGIGFAGVASGSGNGVQGQTTSGIAVEGVAIGATGFSGYFTGGQGMAVNGNFTVNHGFVKSAAVRGKDGTLVRLYCMESPESWFEDFGSGQLSNGSATVPLEPGFAAVVKTDDYHVFLTPRGEPKGPLYVSNVNSAGFTVHEAGGGTSNLGFDYRVVAKRKDIAGVRLEHVDELPAVHLLTLPELPATPPTPPTLGSGR
jgi:hypothetical protein